MAHYVNPNDSALPGRNDWTDGRTAAPVTRVLVVDDELPIRMLLTRMLKGWGYAVRHVGSAVEALEVMAVEPAEILMCDVTMPERDGLWLAREVHAQWPRTAIIMSTGHHDAYTVQTSRKNGAIAYVTKPFVPYVLREAVDRAAGRHNAAAS